jgi:hypothetical protein
MLPAVYVGDFIFGHPIVYQGYDPTPSSYVATPAYWHVRRSAHRPGGHGGAGHRERPTPPRPLLVYTALVGWPGESRPRATRPILTSQMIQLWAAGRSPELSLLSAHIGYARVVTILLVHEVDAHPSRSRLAGRRLRGGWGSGCRMTTRNSPAATARCTSATGYGSTFPVPKTAASTTANGSAALTARRTARSGSI